MFPSLSAASLRKPSECSCRRFLSSRSPSWHSASDVLSTFAHNSRMRSCKQNGDGILRVCRVTTITVHTVGDVSHKTDNTLQGVRTSWGRCEKMKCEWRGSCSPRCVNTQNSPRPTWKRFEKMPGTAEMDHPVPPHFQ